MIKNVNHYSIIIACSSDISEKEQMSVAVLYIPIETTENNYNTVGFKASFLVFFNVVYTTD